MDDLSPLAVLELFSPRTASAKPPVSNRPVPAAVPKEEDNAAIDERRRKTLLRSLNAMSLEELKRTAKQYDTTGAILASPLLMRSREVLRDALHDFFSTVEEESSDPPEVVDAWLATQASPWPEGERAPPTSVAEALDPDGRWGVTACGVEIRLCTDHPSKGRGAFAVRDLSAGSVVCVYAGEVRAAASPRMSCHLA